MNWQPIATSPKYPLDDCQGGPHFLARCADGSIHEVWWEFPRPGSVAYAENYPPSIQRIDANGYRTEHPTHWIPIQPTEETVKEMVNRFLCWQLPKDFAPDGGISFNPTKPDGYNFPGWWPVGTNLLHAGQAEELVRYMLQIPKGE